MNKPKFILLLVLFCAETVLVSAQNRQRILRFEPNTIDLDTIRYDAGMVLVIFECINVSENPVSIVDVKVRCGCVTPRYSKAAIPVGGKGVVEVEFDPHTLFSQQKQPLTVVATNGEYNKFNSLWINAYVQRDVTEAQVRYPYELAPGLRSDVENIGMRLRKRGEVPERSMLLYNDSDRPISIAYACEAKSVKCSVPSVIEPHSKAELSVTVNTKKYRRGSSYQEVLHLFADGHPTKIILIKGSVE